MEKYFIFGAGNFGRIALDIIGSERVSCFIDNDEEKQGKMYYGKEIISLDCFLNRKENGNIIISVSEDKYEDIIAQLKEKNITNFSTFSEFKYEETKKKLLERTNYLEIYNRAIEWIKNNTNSGEGIICNTNLTKSYPEVSGYYIPTLLRWGYKELAIQYAQWLCGIQHADGAWYDTEGNAPYIFDTAQVLKGLIAIREVMPEVDQHIINGCNWILSNMTQEGRVVSPVKDIWGDNKTISELIHTYCISPIREAGELFHNQIYIDAADKIAAYYTTECRDEILNFNLLSHFYAYVMEAMIDIGREDLAREAMTKIASLQKESGAVPAYNNCDWTCSTGLFQLALVWYRLGNIENGDKAFKYACKLQNKSGGWYGSYLLEDNANEINNYFPDAEISWANKYFLDALYWKNVTLFEKQSSIFGDSISESDGRYKCIKEIVADLPSDAKILDIGCGKGRYIKNLCRDYPDKIFYAVDLSEKVLEYFSVDYVEKKKGNITNIPYKDNYFDTVYSCEALEHAVDIESAIREMCRVTCAGGKIAILDKNREKLGYIEIEEWEQWFDREELKQLMLQYCSDVFYTDDIDYDGRKSDGLFGAWIGTVR